MKNSKRDRMKGASEQHERRESASAVQVTDAMWREACKSGKKAKELLVNMSVGPNAKVKMAKLSNGNEIPINEITEQQALDFVTMLAPERVWKGYRQ